jgi:sulfur carrier protein
MDAVKVLLRNPRREVELRGPLSVIALLNKFSFKREAVLVVCNGTLVPGDAMLADHDVVEIRPVISGGCDHSGVGGRERHRSVSPDAPAPEASLGGCR